MKFWTALAWTAYLLAVLTHIAERTDTGRADATYLMAMGCFFLLCGIKERKRDA